MDDLTAPEGLPNSQEEQFIVDLEYLLKLGYNLKITFRVVVYVIGCGVTGLMRKYRKLNLI